MNVLQEDSPRSAFSPPRGVSSSPTLQYSSQLPSKPKRKNISKAPFSLTLPRSYFEQLSQKNRVGPIYDSYTPLTVKTVFKTKVDYEKSSRKTIPKRPKEYPKVNPVAPRLTQKTIANEEDLPAIVLSPPLSRKENIDASLVRKRVVGFVDFDRQVKFMNKTEPSKVEYDLDYQIRESNSKYFRTNPNFSFKQFCIEKFEAKKQLGQQRFFIDKKYDLISKRTDLIVPDLSRASATKRQVSVPPYLFKGFYDYEKPSHHLKSPKFDLYVAPRAMKL